MFRTLLIRQDLVSISTRKKEKKKEEEEEDSLIHILLGSECISLSAASSNPRFRISNLLILLFASS